MEKKVTVTFQVTEDKTEVRTQDLNGVGETIDITGSEIEKMFVNLMKKLQEHKLTNQIMDAIDINKWEEV